MPAVVNIYGDTISITEDLMRDFFEEVYIYDKDLFHILAEYNEDTRYQLSAYIVARLAEVNAGYLPENS